MVQWKVQGHKSKLDICHFWPLRQHRVKNCHSSRVDVCWVLLLCLWDFSGFYLFLVFFGSHLVTSCFILKVCLFVCWALFYFLGPICPSIFTCVLSAPACIYCLIFPCLLAGPSVLFSLVMSCFILAPSVLFCRLLRYPDFSCSLFRCCLWFALLVTLFVSFSFVFGHSCPGSVFCLVLCP